MRKIFFLFCIPMIFAQCQEKAEEVEEQTAPLERPLITEEDGIYTEWYPGHQQIKIKGRKDDNGEKTGIWKMYTPRGVEKSITVYNAGKRDGHIVVRHDNGAIHYTGEYEMDVRVGEWKFYDENGTFVSSEDFGYPQLN
ncbi:MAG: hypothetical protein JJT77_03330 [Crocinitomicaceae bacterium]|nr:hypothetical protein [Crocinitomicaceae bacterium]